LKKYTIDSNEAILTFSHADGLNFKGNEPIELYIIDCNGENYIPQCSIIGNSLKLTWNSEIEIKKIQMGYSNDPKHNLYNKSGYLASPFSVSI